MSLSAGTLASSKFGFKSLSANVGDLDNHMGSHAVGVLIHKVGGGKEDADYGPEFLAIGRGRCSLSQAKAPEGRGTSLGDSVPHRLATPGEVSII